MWALAWICSVEALWADGINIQMTLHPEIGTCIGERNKDDANRAISAVHDKFFGNEGLTDRSFFEAALYHGK